MGLDSILKNVASGATGGFLGGVSDILKDVIADPNKKAEVMQKIEELHTQVQLKQIDESIAQINADKDSQISVNATMQAEGKSEHFLQWSWRPLVGYSLVIYVFNNYILLPYFKNYGLQPIIIDPVTMTAIGAVLGVASWGRSQTAINNSK